MNSDNQDPKSEQKNQEHLSESPQKEGEVFQHVQAEEQLIGLIRRKSQEEQDIKEKEDANSRILQQQHINKLKGILHQKIDEIREVKKSINSCKKQIKEIGEEVDKQMNKSILKHSKPYATVNIRTIFQHPKTSDPQINNLNSQISKMRAELSKTKSQIHSLQSRLSNPINSINQERVNALKTKIKELDAEIRQLALEKQYIEKEIKMQFEDQQQQLDLRDEQLRMNKEKNHEISNMLKQEKTSIYELEKQDRIVTEKIRYMNEVDSFVSVKNRGKNTNTETRSKQQIQAEISQLISEINNTIDKKNRIESERKSQWKNIVTETTSIEAKNWEIINKLRQIDSYLIKHYSTKNQKKQRAKNERPSAEQAMISKQAATVMVKTKLKEFNDKNMTFQSEIPPEPIQMIQKKKTYEFGYNLGIQEEGTPVNLSDEMLGNKIKINTLNFVFDEELIYGIWANYVTNDGGYEVKGYRILPKIRPKQCVTKSLILDESKGQIINFIHTGNNKQGNMQYLHIITSEGNEFKWGDLGLCIKNDQKNIRKYESIVMKGKLLQLMNKQAPNYYCLGGIGFGLSEDTSKGNDIQYDDFSYP